MKFINTKYPKLFDTITGTASINETHQAIYYTYNSVVSIAKNLPNLSSLYVSFHSKTRQQLDYNYYCDLFFIRFASGKYIKFSIKQSTGTMSVYLVNGSTNTLLINNVPIVSNSVVINNYTFLEMYWYVKIDLTENIISVYHSNTKVADISINLSTESIVSAGWGSLGTNVWYILTTYLNNMIISDTEFPMTERVTEVTPTIASTDWTVTNGVASTDVLGATMTLTAPSGSIDETKRVLTGYAIGYMDSTISSTINAIEATQGSSTKQTLLKDAKSSESDVFNVTQLSDISATAVASYISQ